MITQKNNMASALRMFTRKMATTADIKHVTVIGGGLMGSGIAQESIFFKLVFILCLLLYIREMIYNHGT